jgi:SAM-dependent methyltransferase
MANNTMDYRNSHTASDKGILYDDNFLTHSWRAYLWEREKKVLKTIIANNAHKDTYLDFACGTGRIIDYVKQFIKVSVGVDISESMLDVCRKRINGSQIIKADITRENILKNKKFDIITAFRFFPNAQKNLRNEVMMAISDLLKENGIIIFNNHKNATNGFYLLAKLFKRKKISMTKAEVNSLVNECRLEIVSIFPVGALPFHERYMFFPSWICTVVDWLICAIGIGEIFCQDIIYVCKKNECKTS